MELEAALRLKLRIIPVLVSGAGMPTEATLPDVLKPLARRNAVDVRDTRFDADVGVLVSALTETLSPPSRNPPIRGARREDAFGLPLRARPLITAIALIAPVAIGVAIYRLNIEPPVHVDSPPSDAQDGAAADTAADGVSDTVGDQSAAVESLTDADAAELTSRGKEKLKNGEHPLAVSLFRKAAEHGNAGASTPRPGV